VLGLASGVLVAVVAIGAVIALLPEPAPTVAEPSPSAPSTSPSAPAASGTPSLSPSTSPSAGPSVASGAPSGSLATAFHIGEQAPPLDLPQVGGGAIDLAALRGKPVWVNFMQTTCPPCVDEFPLMSRFAARHADDGLVVIAVDIQEDEGVVAAFAQSLNANFPIALDGDGAAQDAWQAYGLPVHFWVDKDGIVRDGALGGIGPDIMARGLAAIMPGVEVTP
jgi:cytochrome c biogenesis protein CcmG, thiol:disulfide interchange protein DsbE